MANFISLYRGATLAAAKLVAISSNPAIVSEFADRLIHESVDEDDPVLRAKDGGQRRALKIIRDGEKQAETSLAQG